MMGHSVCFLFANSVLLHIVYIPLGSLVVVQVFVH